jgi:hypothetical protein
VKYLENTDRQCKYACKFGVAGIFHFCLWYYYGADGGFAGIYVDHHVPGQKPMLVKLVSVLQILAMHGVTKMPGSIYSGFCQNNTGLFVL